MAQKPFVEETVTVEIDAHNWTVSPIGYADLQALRSHIRSRRVVDFRAAAGDLPVDERVKIIASLAAREVTVEDLDAELATADGPIFLVWRSLVKNHPDVTLDKAAKLVGAQAGLTQTVTAISGLLSGEEPTTRPIRKKARGKKPSPRSQGSTA